MSSQIVFSVTRVEFNAWAYHFHSCSNWSEPKGADVRESVRSPVARTTEGRTESTTILQNLLKSGIRSGETIKYRSNSYHSSRESLRLIVAEKIAL